MNLIKFARRQARVYDDRPRIERAASEYERGERNGILACQQHAVSRPDLQAHQIGGDGIDRLREFTIAPRATTFYEGWMSRPFGDMGCNGLRLFDSAALQECPPRT